MPPHCRWTSQGWWVHECNQWQGNDDKVFEKIPLSGKLLKRKEIFTFVVKKSLKNF